MCVCSFGFFLCFYTVCVVSLLGANAEIKFTIPVGRIFTYELMKETFQNDFEPLSKLYGNSVMDSLSSLPIRQSSNIFCSLQGACTATP